MMKRIVMIGLVMVVAGAIVWYGSRAGRSDTPVLSGVVKGARGEPLGGATLRTSLANTNMTFTVFTDREGRYVYRQLSPGQYTVEVAKPGFQPVHREGVNLQGGEQMDFALAPSRPSLDELTTTELLMGLPGTEEQKAEAAGCSNCHPLHFVFERPKRDKQGWLHIIEIMRGIRNDRTQPSEEELRAIRKRTGEANNRLAEYLAMVRGPDSPEVPYKLLEFPTNDDYSRVQITEYRIPRGSREILTRGDTAGAWTHDVLVDPERRYVWYTEHYQNILGRLDPKSGEIKEFKYERLRLGGRPGGAHQLSFDTEGKIWLGAVWQGMFVKFDPEKEKFQEWLIEGFDQFSSPMIEVDWQGNAWLSASPYIYRLEPASGKITKFTIPSRGIYGMTINNSRDVLFFCGSGSGKVGIFDIRAEKFTEWETSSRDSFPRRGTRGVDGQDRFWFAMFHAGKIGRLDYKVGELREWTLSDRPYTAPYDVAVDRKNQLVWTSDFNSNRIFRFDMRTEQVTEFLLPDPGVEIRQLMVDTSTTPASLWIPDYSPPGKLLKVQVW